ncbi:MAG TPA: inorganic phosphate transporter [Phycisphaerae bacterium]|nr:inorganic phosphate transporter [Phycisphaerae bacterium]
MLFYQVALILAVVMLIWNTVEVGRNDAANLVNAVFGARILNRKLAVRVAGIGVVLGAVASGGVIETARKGIFDPHQLTLQSAVSVYVCVYIVNTVLLYVYSAYGMPVSTTASLVFALLGASFAAKGAEVVKWASAGTVVTGIICSIVLSGVFAFLVQRAVRGAIRDRPQHLATLLLHGGWVGGGMTAGLCYFLMAKGMKHVGFIRYLNEHVVDRYGGDAVVVLFLWGVFAIVIHALLVIYRQRAARLLFPVLAVVAMIAMAFAFGQNDLANCASPGLSVWNLIKAGNVDIGTAVPIPLWALFGCGLLLVLGMGTKNAERVTRAEVATGSMSDHVGLWAPRWCVGLASHLLRFRGRAPSLAPYPTVDERGETRHYDSLRACVILSVSASVIATASGLKLPVSTTYVAFAAVVATGMADRIFQRGDAALKLARSIWVAFSWFASAAIAATAAALVCLAVVHLGTAGIIIALAANATVRIYLQRRADAQHKRVEDEAYERAHPDEFALEDED